MHPTIHSADRIGQLSQGQRACSRRRSELTQHGHNLGRGGEGRGGEGRGGEGRGREGKGREELNTTIH